MQFQQFSYLKRFWQDRHGFTLVEMVMVVGVLAILVGISTPALYQMMLKQDIQEEEIALQEIRKAIELYAEERNVLPTNLDDWSTELAGYTKLSQQQIANSVWGHPRTFRIFVTNRQVQGVDLSIAYVTVLSTGQDRTANAAPNLPVSSGQFAAWDDAGWWYKQTDPVGKFGSLTPANNDLIVTFTDYPLKIKQLQETLKRMNRIVTAMDALSKTSYSELIARCVTEARDAGGNVTSAWAPLCNNGMPEQLIYIPRSQTANPAQTPVDSDNNYYAPPGNIAPSVYTTNGSLSTRKAQIESIVRTLGLSDETCCSALTGDPFYYYSNPRPKLAGSMCAATRLGPTERKLPARITTVQDPCG